jgi:hypothetical protein
LDNECRYSRPLRLRRLHQVPWTGVPIVQDIRRIRSQSIFPDRIELHSILNSDRGWAYTNILHEAGLVYCASEWSEGVQGTASLGSIQHREGSHTGWTARNGHFDRSCGGADGWWTARCKVWCFGCRGCGGFLVNSERELNSEGGFVSLRRFPQPNHELLVCSESSYREYQLYLPCH